MSNSTLYLENNIFSIKKDLISLVKAESPSNNVEPVNKCGNLIKSMMKNRLDINFHFKEFTQKKYGNHLLFEPESNGRARVLFLSHFDTVWEKGEIPLKDKGDLIFGPGIFDMKAGIISPIWAVSYLLHNRDSLPIDPVFLFTSDEEVGSISSRPIIEEIAMKCNAVFVMEPPEVYNDALKTARKGVGIYRISAKGKSTHAGNHRKFLYFIY